MDWFYDCGETFGTKSVPGLTILSWLSMGSRLKDICVVSLPPGSLGF